MEKRYFVHVFYSVWGNSKNVSIIRTVIDQKTGIMNYSETRRKNVSASLVAYMFKHAEKIEYVESLEDVTASFHTVVHATDYYTLQ